MNRILYKLKNAILFLAVYIVIFFITMFINENLAAVMLAGIVIGVPIYLGYLLLETVKYFMNKKIRMLYRHNKRHCRYVDGIETSKCLNATLIVVFKLIM